MATERWIRMQDGQLQIVEALDGPAFLRARRQGKPSQWVTPTTLEALIHQYGAGSDLVRDARAALGQEPEETP